MQVKEQLILNQVQRLENELREKKIRLNQIQDISKLKDKLKNAKIKDKLFVETEAIRNVGKIIRRAIVARRKENFIITAGNGSNKLHIEKDKYGKSIIKSSGKQCNPIEAVLLNNKVAPVVIFNSFNVKTTAVNALNRPKVWIETFLAGFSNKRFPNVQLIYVSVYNLGLRIREELFHPRRLQQDQINLKKEGK